MLQSASKESLGSAAQKVLAYVNGKAMEIVLVSIGQGHRLRADAAAAYERLAAAASADSVLLIINSSFRSMEEQQRLYADWLSGKRTAVVARPGYSNHQAGLALDVNGGKAQAWLRANGWRFGFYGTVPSEPWHWEYKT